MNPTFAWVPVHEYAPDHFPGSQVMVSHPSGHQTSGTVRERARNGALLLVELPAGTPNDGLWCVR